jgi:WD40 repeat protein
MSAHAVALRPYIGLRYFEESDAHLFYGRDEHVTELLGKVAVNRFVAVMGSSGSGKSSLVRAGLLPELRSGMIPKAGPRWKVVEFKPGIAPLESLSAALASTLDAPDSRRIVEEGPLGLARAIAEAHLEEGTNILVIADQFEEVFRFQREEAAQGRSAEAAEQCHALVRRLLDAAAQSELPIYVLLVMRSDYLGECAQFPELPERMSESIYLVPRLRRDQLQEAITAPSGGRIEPAVVQRLLSEVGNDPDQLPRLQHLLGRMWDRAASGRLTMQHYTESGGWEKGLEQHLEEVYNSLAQPTRGACRRLFQQLSELDKGRAVRRRAEIFELEQVCGPEASHVVSAFRAEGFLLPQNSPVDITHECILREWPRVREWLEKEEHGAKRLRELTDAAKDAGWKPGIRDSSIAGLEGLTLQNLVTWRNENRPTAEWASRYSTAVDFAVAEDYLAWSEERDRNQKRSARRRRNLLMVCLALVPVGLGLATWETNIQKKAAVRESIRAREAEKGAVDSLTRLQQTKAELADNLRETKQAQLSAQNSLTRLQQTQAELADNLRKQESLTLAVRFSGLPAFALALENEDPATALYLGWRAASKGGPLPIGLEQILATALAHRSSFGVLRGHTAAVRAVHWSPDGKIITTAADDGTIRVWNAETAAELRILPGPQGKLHLATWSPDGQLLAYSGADNSVRLWSPGGSRALDTGHEIAALAWSPDGRSLAVANKILMSNGVQVWDVASGRVAATIGDMQTKVNAIAWRPDGKQIAIGGADLSGGKVLLSDPSGTQITSVAGTQSEVTSVTWAAKGTLVVTTDTLRVQVGDSGFLDSDVRIERGLPNPAGTEFALAGENKIELWRPGFGRIGVFSGHSNTITALSWSPDGETLASTSEDRTVRLWHRTQREELRTLSGDNAFSWSPNSKLIASAGNNGVQLWEAQTGAPAGRLPGCGNSRIPVAWSPDGLHVACESGDGSIHIRRVDSGSEVQVLHSDRGFRAFTWTPGRFLASVGLDKEVRIWDWASGTEIRHFGLFGQSVTGFGWSPDGRILAASVADYVNLWGPQGEYPMRILGSPDSGEASAFAWSPDGKLVASAGVTVQVWDTSAGRVLQRIRGTEGSGFKDIAWSPDGSTLGTTTSYSATVRLWDLKTGELRRSIITNAEYPGTQAGHMAWSPDGSTLAVATPSGIQLWPGSVDALLNQLRDRIRLFSLSNEDCLRYFGSESCPAPR